MKKILVTLSIVISSCMSYAANPDFSVLSDMHGHDQGKMRECLKAGWDATSATDAQNRSMQAFMAAVRDLYMQSKGAIMTAARELSLSWAHQPVDRNLVMNAELTLNQLVQPIKDASRDSGISILNLLTIEQRSAFDHAFQGCMQK